MKIACFRPPAAQRVGGLDAAIEGINTALGKSGIDVLDSPPVDAEFDVAHFHGLWQLDHARLGRRLRERGIPYVVSPHGMLESWAWRHKWWKKWPYFHVVEKHHLAHAAALLATGTAEARRLARFAPRQRIESLPLGLTGAARPNYESARRELGWAPEEIVLLYLSRLHVKKGADLLLHALASSRWPAVTRLVMVGDGDRRYVDSLRAFADRESGRLPRIDWVGPVWGAARWKYFQGADLFCLPTHSENFGLAVLEALQVGTPVLTTTDTPWVDDVSGVRGFITDPNVESIRSGLATFFAQPLTKTAARQEICDWAWNRFDWSHLGPRYAEFLVGIARREPPARVS